MQVYVVNFGNGYERNIVGIFDEKPQQLVDEMNAALPPKVDYMSPSYSIQTLGVARRTEFYHVIIRAMRGQGYHIDAIMGVYNSLEELPAMAHSKVSSSRRAIIPANRLRPEFKMELHRGGTGEPSAELRRCNAITKAINSLVDFSCQKRSEHSRAE